MSLQPVVIVGAGGHGRELHHLLDRVNAHRSRFRILGYLDADSTLHGRQVNGTTVLGGIEWIETCGEDRLAAVIGINAPGAKRRLGLRISGMGVELPPVVHPGVNLGRFVDVSEGVVITEGCVLTCNIQLGRFVCLNRQVGVGHDVNIGDYCSINPHVILSGNVSVEAGVEVGTNASVIQGLKLGEGSQIGAGATVTHDVPGNVTVVGTPARAIRALAPWHGR